MLNDVNQPNRIGSCTLAVCDCKIWSNYRAITS